MEAKKKKKKKSRKPIEIPGIDWERVTIREIKERKKKVIKKGGH